MHRAVLDRGAEVEYYPPDHPELKNLSYIDGGAYSALVGRVIDLAGVDIENLGCRSTLVSRAIWRWIERTAVREIPDLWQHLISVRSCTALLSELQDLIKGKRIQSSQLYVASDLASVVRFGYWLFREGKLSGSPIIGSVVWGLAVIGAAWGLQLRCRRCRICFRQSRPGEMHCDFHSQSAATPPSPSKKYQGYRYGRLAKALALQDQNIAPLIFGSRLQEYVQERLALPEVLFPLKPLDDDWCQERNALISSLESSPRVVLAAGIHRFHEMPYEILVERLRKEIDPHDWSTDLWEVKVLQAELWLRLEEEVRPSIRGLGRKTPDQLNRAIELARQGYSKKQIAAALCVTSSTVSHWIRRYPDFRDVCYVGRFVSVKG